MLETIQIVPIYGAVNDELYLERCYRPSLTLNDTFLLVVIIVIEAKGNKQHK